MMAMIVLMAVSINQLPVFLRSYDIDYDIIK